MKPKSKSKPAQKTAAKTAAKRKATPAKAGSAKAGAKKAAPGKPAARKGAAAPARQSGPAPKRTKAKNIFAKKQKPTGSKAKTRPTAAKPDQDLIAHNAPLIDALDQALLGIPPENGPQDVAMSGERRGIALSGGGPSTARPSLGETGAEPADAPARINKLVPTNAVHTTKRRMKRNTWQSPVLGLAAVAAVLAILVLGNRNEPPDVSPLERRAEVRPETGLPQTATKPDPQDPVQAAPDRRPQIPSRLAQPALAPVRSGEAAQGEAPAQEPERGLRVLELVEMERMLERLDMEPSRPDGVVDQQTESAIRMYQQIAGLPVDGEPSPELLDDMREVVKMMDVAD